MTEVIGDIVIPSELIVPDKTDVATAEKTLAVSGAYMFVSGADLFCTIAAATTKLT